MVDSLGEVLAGQRAWSVVCGEALAVLGRIPDGVVQCVCTSPPYFQVRHYGTGRWEGGDPACQHRRSPARQDHSGSTFSDTRGKQGGAATSGIPYGPLCSKCGAVRIDQQVGMEAALDCLGWARGNRCGACFICRLTAIFREVRRVLRPDGTLWLNIGDGFAGSGKGSGGGYKAERRAWQEGHTGNGRLENRTLPGLRNKNLLGVPWRLAFSLQADGWLLRQEIRWCKKSPMPEGACDRAHSAVETIFFLTRSSRYYYDRYAEMVPSEDGQGFRELWNYWLLASEPNKHKHYASFPSEIPRRCFRLGTSLQGCCPHCGAPRRRMLEKTKRLRKRPNDLGKRTGEKGTGNVCPNTTAGVDVRTLGWAPTCRCTVAEPVPCLTLDPFCGSGTSGVVARRLGLRFVGIDLSEPYCELARCRLTKNAPLFDLAQVVSPSSLFEEEP